MEMNILLLPGDGIGPEISRQAEKVLDAISETIGFEILVTRALIGGAAIDATGVALPEETLEAAYDADAVLLAAVGGPKWDSTDPAAPRPEDGLLGLRKNLGLFANLRPVRVYDALIDSSPLKADIVRGTDLLFVRELTGGIYFGHKERTELGAVDTCTYSREEIKRTLRVAFDAAARRRKKVTLVDKANVLETSRLWRELFLDMARERPDIETEILLVDNAAMQLLKRPSAFDVIVTENMFGDILSDEASMISGSIGMLASASLGETHPFLYEPIHGSAPDIAGKNLANPIAMILSVALMLRYSFDQNDLAAALELAVERVIDDGYRTADLAAPGERKQLIGTNEMGDLIVDEFRKLLAGESRHDA